MNKFKPLFLYFNFDKEIRIYTYPCGMYEKYVKNKLIDSFCENTWKSTKCVVINNSFHCCYNFDESLLELLKQIQIGRNLALLNIRHDNEAIRKACELKLQDIEFDVKETDLT